MICAYIDPSSMTYLIQIVAGVVVAATAGIGFYWKRIRRYFRNKKRAREEAAMMQKAQQQAAQSAAQAADVDAAQPVEATPTEK